MHSLCNTWNLAFPDVEYNNLYLSDVKELLRQVEYRVWAKKYPSDDMVNIMISFQVPEKDLFFYSARELLELVDIKNICVKETRVPP
jgi:hypothetical protein